MRVWPKQLWARSLFTNDMTPRTKVTCLIMPRRQQRMDRHTNLETNSDADDLGTGTQLNADHPLGSLVTPQTPGNFAYRSYAFPE